MAVSSSGRRRPQAVLLATVLTVVVAALLPVGRCQTWPTACNTLGTPVSITSSPATLTTGTRYTTSLATLELTAPVTVGSAQVLCIHSSAGTDVTLPASTPTHSAHFSLQSGGALYLIGVDLVGGTALGGVSMVGGTLDMTGGELRSCNGPLDGSISVISGGTITSARLDGVTITHAGDAASSTRAISVMQGAAGTATFVFHGATSINDNNAAVGAGIAVSGAGSATFTFNGPTTFANNVATSGDGGAIHVSGATTTTLTFNAAVTFSSNTATTGVGGAIYLGPAAGRTATLTFVGDATFANNAKGSAVSGAGALHAGVAGGGPVSVRFDGLTTFTNNNSPGGGTSAGAVYATGAMGASVAFTGTTVFSNNLASGVGSFSAGAVLIDGGFVVFGTSTSFDNNAADPTESAGALRLGAGGTATFNGAATFGNNLATGSASAGAVAASTGCTLQFSSTTFTANSANGADSAGALRLDAVGATAAFDGAVTFDRNQANGIASAGAVSAYATTTLQLNNDAIFTDNSASGAKSAGALRLDSSTMAIYGTPTFSSNDAYGALSAGAVFVGGTSTLTCDSGATFTANRAVGSNSAGAISIQGTGSSVFISASNPAATAVFSDNTAPGTGTTAGAMLILSGSSTVGITCPTSFRNNAAIGGTISAGAIAIASAGSTTLSLTGTSTCFVGNQGAGSDGAGVISVTGGPCTLAFGAATAANFGSNTVVGGIERDLKLINAFTCGGTSKPAGTYSVEGNLCAASCTGTSCTCPLGEKFAPASCACVLGAPCTNKPTVPVVPNGANWPDACAGTTSGQTCTGVCANGYLGSFAARCNEGSWALVSGSCNPTPCNGAPTTGVANGAWSCSGSTPDGGSCTAVCSSGFQGSPSVRCSLGTWSTTVVGACTPAACAALTAPTPPNTLGWPSDCTNAASLQSGSSCIAPCQVGLSGGVTATCMHGSWSISGTCADCRAQLLAPAQPQAAVCHGTTALSGMFAYAAPFGHQSTAFAASISGGSCTPPAGLTGSQPSSVNVPVTCTTAVPFTPGTHTIGLTATVAAAVPCPASSTTPPANITFTVNPEPVVSLALQSVSVPCPGDNVTTVFAFNVTGLTPGAGAVVVQAAVSSSAAGTACTVLSVTQTDDVAAGRSSGLVRATCRGPYGAGASVPVNMQLSTQQGACIGASASTTAATIVACCITSGSAAGLSGAAGASSVAVLTGAARGSCWAHQAVNTPCTSSSQPATGPPSWSYVNRGEVAGGVLLAGIQSGCATTSALDVGVASTSCSSSGAMLFNVTVDAGSSIALHFWVGCRLPSDMTAGTTSRCSTWKQVPSSIGPNSSLKPAIAVNNGYASHTWVNKLPANPTCNCGSLYWAVSASGTFRASAPQCAQASSNGATAVTRPARLRGRRGPN